MGRKLSWLGILITAAYALFWTWVLWGRLPEIKKLPLNELGDFLAGGFGPLAILWLILGFFQQGIELRQNSAALHLQAEELKNSVEQQKQMVEVARLEHDANLHALAFERQKIQEAKEEASRAAQPRFLFAAAGSSTGGAQSSWSWSLTNTGGECSDVRLTLDSGDSPLKTPSMLIPHLARGANHQISFTMSGGRFPASATLKLDYVDRFGRPGRAQFQVVVEGSGMTLIEAKPELPAVT